MGISRRKILAIGGLGAVAAATDSLGMVLGDHTAEAAVAPPLTTLDQTLTRSLVPNGN